MFRLNSLARLQRSDVTRNSCSHSSHIHSLFIYVFLFRAENLAPSELKKLRNKQRKARRKAEQESAQAAQAQVKRDQHHKSRQQSDVEADAPQLDELVPDKLARVTKTTTTKTKIIP